MVKLLKNFKNTSLVVKKLKDVIQIHKFRHIITKRQMKKANNIMKTLNQITLHQILHINHLSLIIYLILSAKIMGEFVLLNQIRASIKFYKNSKNNNKLRLKLKKELPSKWESSRPQMTFLFLIQVLLAYISF